MSAENVNAYDQAKMSISDCTRRLVLYQRINAPLVLMENEARYLAKMCRKAMVALGIVDPPEELTEERVQQIVATTLVMAVGETLDVIQEYGNEGREPWEPEERWSAEDKTRIAVLVKERIGKRAAR